MTSQIYDISQYIQTNKYTHTLRKANDHCCGGIFLFDYVYVCIAYFQAIIKIQNKREREGERESGE